MFGVRNNHHHHHPRGTVFSEADPRWRCCCDSCHVRTGALIIGYLQLALIVVGSLMLGGLLIYSALQHSDDADKRAVAVPVLDDQHSYSYNINANSAHFKTAVAGYGVTFGIQLLVVITLLYGAHTEKRIWLWPHMVFSLMGVGLSVLRLLSTMGGGLHRWNHSTQNHAVGSQLSGIFLGMAIHMWFYMIVYRFYQYIGEKQQPFYFVSGNNPVMPPAVGDVVNGAPPTYATATHAGGPPPAYPGLMQAAKMEAKQQLVE